MGNVTERSIVWAEGPDRRGQNWKARPWVVLADPVSGVVTVVALGVTTDQAGTPPEIAVKLPAKAPEGHPVTGLVRGCSAVCNWVIDLQLKDILEVRGKVPEREWNRILRILGELAG